MAFHCLLRFTDAQAGVETGLLSDASSPEGQYVRAGNDHDHGLYRKQKAGYQKAGIDNTLQLAMCFHVHFLNSVFLHIL